MTGRFSLIALCLLSACGTAGAHDGGAPDSAVPDSGARGCGGFGGGAEEGLTTDRAALDFGPVAVGQTTVPAGVTILPAVYGAIDGVTLVGSDADQFALDDGNCPGVFVTLGPRFTQPQRCPVAIRFHPIRAGTSSAMLEIAGRGNGVCLPLNGSAFLPAALAFDPQQASVASPLAVPARPLTFTLTNSSATASGPVSLRLAGSDATLFELVATTCAGTTLAPNATCDVTVVFDGGTARGPREVSLVAQVAGATVGAASVGGVGLAPPELVFWREPTASFGNTVVGATCCPSPITVRNVGDLPSSSLDASKLGGTDPGSFQIVSDACGGHVLDAGQACDVTVAFTPMVTGALSATLTVSAADGGATVAQLSGYGL